MGLFDWVLVDCPRCGKKVEDQVKNGDPTMSTYRVKLNEPISVYDAHMMCGVYSCQSCSCLFEVKAPDVYLSVEVLGDEV